MPKIPVRSSAASSISFNPTNLATYDEARALRDYLNSTQAFAANPILSGDDEIAPAPVPNPNFPWLPPVVPAVGIYLPYWVGGPGGFPEPADGSAMFLHFRTFNGREGFNVGLVREKFKSFPANADYVLQVLAADMA